MGLFINKNEHPTVFKNPQFLKEPNQEVERIDYLSQFLQQQQEASSALRHSFEHLKNHNLEQEFLQASQWKEISDKLNELKNKSSQHTDFEAQMLEWLKSIAEKNIVLHGLLKEESKFKENVAGQLTIQKQATKEISYRLEKQEALQNVISEQLKEQTVVQKQMAENLLKQEEFQNDVLVRLEKQEALSEKIFRQINTIRSILYERTNYLAEKITEGCKVTSSYVYKIMTGSDQPYTFFLKNNKKEENKINTIGSSDE
ncbi:hypothetical protein [Neobacillus terrae]|uniref:hypothetical protein n=1 Tax=Neobacillus terrae TaxID=3034837 RepID=UPI00140A381B|nr:hypothetical protein [Neobacillus terrae]NHM33036.1 hypothetical protein [Neobacillus terrae]